jgi:DNA primase
MTTSTESPIEAAKRRHRLAQVAARTGIYLPATTGTLTVRCPLPAHGHPDRTPSMRLYLDDDRYYCFGCGTKGDIIQWVQDAEGLNVTAALKVIEKGRPIANAWTGRGPTVELVGTHRPAARGETPDLRRTTPGRVRQALQDAWKLYSVPVMHRLGVGYLARRRIGIELLERHTGRAEVGHTPPNPATLMERLRDGGYSEDELIDAGLGRRHQQAEPVVDFYRHRALIPLRDEAAPSWGWWAGTSLTPAGPST